MTYNENRKSKNPIIIHNTKGSNFGNMMIKYIVAKKIVENLDGVILSNYDMPYWDINHPLIDERGLSPLHFTHDQCLDINRVRYLISLGLFSSVELHGHLQRMENFPSNFIARNYFRSSNCSGCRFGEKFLVCPIRGGEVLNAIHPGYSLLPINFYAEIIRETCLIPVFCGQTDDNIYIHELRRKFPNAIFLSHQGQIADFDTIRFSQNIILPISTFAWMAAWLSDATTIYFPVYGLFNPRQFPDHDLIPVGDRRYVFYQFPVQDAVTIGEYEKAHRMIDGSWHAVSAENLAKEYITKKFP
jgi:hypothetical protein